jgi:hypothetical protein
MRFLEYGIKHAIASNFPISDALIGRKQRSQINSSNCDSRILNLLKSPNGVAIGRLGGTEGRYLGDLIKVYGATRSIGYLHQRFARYDLEKRRSEVNSNAGFFFLDHKEELEFMELYLKSLRNLDALGAWGDAFTWAESIASENLSIDILPLAALSPWVEPFPYLNPFAANEPWTIGLRGLKVLVVSPFSESIKAQRSKISKCFEGVGYPEFELITVTAPMTFNLKADAKNNWFANLDNLYSQVRSSEFDVAFVGAGAYSLPLVSKIKDLGRKAIHTGGGTQLFFGVMGNRWNHAPYVQKYVNENWVRPSLGEIPVSAQTIEDGCYW